jgi:hypothetical protein
MLVPADNRRQLTVHSPQHIFLTFKTYFFVTATKEDFHELKDICFKQRKAKREDLLNAPVLHELLSSQRGYRSKFAAFP